MIQKDYIMRLVQQLSEVLAKIAFAKQAKNFDEALQISQNAYDELFGLSGEMPHKLDAAILAQLLNDKEKIKAFAALMHEEGNVLIEQGNLRDGRAKYSKALELYEEVLAMLPEDQDCKSAIQELQIKIHH